MQHIKQLARHNWLIHHTLKECEQKNMSEIRTLTRLVEVLANENRKLHDALTDNLQVCHNLDDAYLQQIVNRSVMGVG